MPKARTSCAAAFATVVFAASASLVGGEPKAGEKGDEKAGGGQKTAGKTDRIPTAKGVLDVTPIEHATFALRWNGATVYVDPVGGAGKFRGLPPPDLVILTDLHPYHYKGQDPKKFKALVEAKSKDIDVRLRDWYGKS